MYIIIILLIITSCKNLHRSAYLQKWKYSFLIIWCCKQDENSILLLRKVLQTDRQLFKKQLCEVHFLYSLTFSPNISTVNRFFSILFYFEYCLLQLFHFYLMTVKCNLCMKRQHYTGRSTIRTSYVISHPVVKADSVAYSWNKFPEVHPVVVSCKLQFRVI